MQDRSRVLDHVRGGALAMGLVACAMGAAFAASLLTVDDGSSIRFAIADNGSTVIGASAASPDAMLDVNSPDPGNPRGLLPPRLTTALRDAIGGGSPTAGMMVYNTTTQSLEVYNGSNWIKLSGAASSSLFSELFDYTDQGVADAAWPTSDPVHARVGINPLNRLNFTNRRDTSHDGIAYDLQSFFGNAVSDTAWTLRWKLRATTWTTDGDSVFWIGLTDGNHSVPSNGVQSALGMELRNNSAERRVGATWKTGGTAHLTDANNQNTPFSWATAVDYYLEINRDGSSGTVSIYCQNTFAPADLLATATTAGITGLTGLRYIKVSNITSSSTTPADEFVGWIDDVQFWDGTASP